MICLQKAISGKAGEQGIIEEIKNNEKATIYLIKKREP